MKKKIVLFLLLLFALFAVVFAVPRIMEQVGKESGGDSSGAIEDLPTETLETTETETTEPETAETESESETNPPDPGPGEPVDREKIVTDLLFASDVHYLSPSLTDYGSAFETMTNKGDGRVVRYMTQIWQAFAEEVIAARPDLLILCGDLTSDGEKANHEELAARLAELEAAGISVAVIPGNHDINNPRARSYFGEEESYVEGVTPEEFREIYGAFGYDEAVSWAPDSLSYLYVLNDTTWLMMLDTCIYEPQNEVDGEIRPGTVQWMKQCLKDAYSQGITVIPVGHHNLQELSRVYVDECVIRNRAEILSLLEYYRTPAYFSGHLHVQRIMKHKTEPGISDDFYGIWEVVSNSLIIPPCQYGRLTLNADGSMSYHTVNVDVSGWAAKHGEISQDLLDFPAFSDRYLRTVISRQIYNKIDDIPDYIREEMANFYADLYQDYYAGRQINYSEKKKEYPYAWWDRFMNPSVSFRQVEGMMRDGMAVNNNAEIPNPIHMEKMEKIINE